MEIPRISYLVKVDKSILKYVHQLVREFLMSQLQSVSLVGSKLVDLAEVLRNLRTSFGESCLFLSGGGMLGMYHIGSSA